MRRLIAAATLGLCFNAQAETLVIPSLIVAGDRAVLHLHFRGHFSGTFESLQGHGQRVDFRATDIYRIGDGRIDANWHLEDNLSLMQQLQAAAG